MATEAPQIRDGNFLKAAANYCDPAVALSGPGGSGQFLAVFVSADNTATIQTADTGQFYGILQNTPRLGEICDVCYEGISKAVAGNVIVAGTEVMMDSSGRVIPWVGSTKTKVGLALEGAITNKVLAIKVYSTPYNTLT